MKKPTTLTPITPERKLGYKKLGLFLKEHPQITYKRLSPYGFNIDIRTVPENLVDEFISISTF